MKLHDGGGRNRPNVVGIEYAEQGFCDFRKFVVNFEVDARGQKGESLDETFDVGIDLRTPVDDKDYQVPFRFTGKLAKLTFKLGPEQLTKEDRKAMAEALASARD